MNNLECSRNGRLLSVVLTFFYIFTTNLRRFLENLKIILRFVEIWPQVFFIDAMPFYPVYNFLLKPLKIFISSTRWSGDIVLSLHLWLFPPIFPLFVENGCVLFQWPVSHHILHSIVGRRRSDGESRSPMSVDGFVVRVFRSCYHAGAEMSRDCHS